MKEGLSPLSGHTAAVRSKLARKSLKNNKSKEPNPTDICKRCNMIGHWAKNCRNEPEPEWLAEQVCFKCGLHGHLAIQCKSSSKPISTHTKGKTKHINLPALVCLLESEDLAKNQKYHVLKDDPPSGIADVRPYLKQRSDA